MQRESLHTLDGVGFLSMSCVSYKIIFQVAAKHKGHVNMPLKAQIEGEVS